VTIVGRIATSGVGVKLDTGVGKSRVGVEEGADVGVTVQVGGKVTGRSVADSE
jgi:hypothetical protein